MSEIKDRLKELRKHLGLTQQDFSERIGIKQNTYSQYETGRNAPIDSVFTLICREFGVSEAWLRRGDGEMFMENTQAYRQLREKVDRMLSDESDAFRAALVDVVMHLNSEQIDILKEYAATYYGVDVGSGLASQESAGSGPDPGAAPREADISQGPAFDQASAETAAAGSESRPDQADAAFDDYEPTIEEKVEAYRQALLEEEALKKAGEAV